MTTQPHMIMRSNVVLLQVSKLSTLSYRELERLSRQQIAEDDYLPHHKWYPSTVQALNELSEERLDAIVSHYQLSAKNESEWITDWEACTTHKEKRERFSDFIGVKYYLLQPRSLRQRMKDIGVRLDVLLKCPGVTEDGILLDINKPIIANRGVDGYRDLHSDHWAEFKQKYRRLALCEDCDAMREGERICECVVL